jgi:hypothetical protein
VEGDAFVDEADSDAGDDAEAAPNGGDGDGDLQVVGVASAEALAAARWAQAEASGAVVAVDADAPEAAAAGAGEVEAVGEAYGEAVGGKRKHAVASGKDGPTGDASSAMVKREKLDDDGGEAAAAGDGDEDGDDDDDEDPDGPPLMPFASAFAGCAPAPGLPRLSRAAAARLDVLLAHG